MSYGLSYSKIPKPAIKPRIWFQSSIGYWLCGAPGTYVVAAGMTPREAYNWWIITRNAI